MRIIFTVVAFLLFISIIGCAEPNLQKEDAGVVLHGHIAPSYLENKNEFPVYVRCVIAADNHGETTQFFTFIEPKQKYHFDSRQCYAYHIYKGTEGQQQIGFIRPR